MNDIQPVKSPHIPVLLSQTLEYLDIQENDIVLDATIGFGGHSSEILNKLNNTGLLIGIDQDMEAVNFCLNRFSSAKNVRLDNLRFDEFEDTLKKFEVTKVNKVLIDLGMSSFQLDSANRGFSFQRYDEPLDMRMDTNGNRKTAAKVLNSYSEEELIRIFREFGEIYKCERFVQQILENRKLVPLTDVDSLMYCIKKGFYFRNNRQLFMKTCSQVFQALRIEVNGEWDALKSFLDEILNYLSVDGRIAIISFHSLEDRMIKEFGKSHRDQLTPLHSKVIQADQTEIRKNMRAKPAKMRVFKKIV